MGGTTKQFGGLGKMLAGGAVVAGITAIGAVALQVGKELFNAASAAEEVNSKFNAVFKENSAAVNKWATDWAVATGQGVTELKGFLATLQDTFVPLGFARGEAAEMSKTLVTLAGDLSSFNNIPTADVVRDLQSALVGNVEVLRKYGVVASEAAIQQEALASGLVENKNEITAQIKAQAILQLTMNGTADAQGDLLRTQDSAANTMRRLDSSILSLKENYGKLLTDALTPVASALADHISKLSELRRIANEAADAEERMAAGVGTLQDELAVALQDRANIERSIARGDTQRNRDRLEQHNRFIDTLEMEIALMQGSANDEAAAAQRQAAIDEKAHQDELQRLADAQIAREKAAADALALAEFAAQERQRILTDSLGRTQAVQDEELELWAIYEQARTTLAAEEEAKRLAAEEEGFNKRLAMAETTLSILTQNAGLIGEAFATGEDAAKAFGKVAVLAVADGIDAIAQLAIAQAAVAAAAFNFVKAGGLLAAGIGASIAAGAVRASASKFQSGTGPEGFQVPQGFENDNFPVSASSGETVRVDRPGEGGGQMLTNVINIDGRQLMEVITEASDAGRGRINPRIVRA